MEWKRGWCRSMVEMVWVRFAALRGKLLRKLMLPFNLPRGLWQARQALQQVKPDVVLGMGGYITFPGGVMAWLQGDSSGLA